MQNKIKQSETKTLNRSEINFASYNPRKLSEEARKQLKKNIKDNGLLGGIIINERTGNIVSGHQRISIADELNKFKEGSIENDYPIKVEVINVDDKKEKELNIFMNSRATQGEYDYKKLAQIFPDIDAELAGLDDVDVSMIEVELPSDMDISIPTFEPQEHKREEANESKTKQDEANEANASNVIYHPDGKLEDLERAENEKENELSYEERKAKIKEIKEAVKNGATIEGDPYFTISFSSYQNKVEFLERFNMPIDTTFVKGEELADNIDKCYENG